MDPEALRADIPAVEETAYMNTGASGPSPRHVVDAATDFLERHEYEAHAAGEPYEMAWQAFEKQRARVADFLGTDAPNVALTQSTADGLSRLAAAIDWEPGDVAVYTDLEHPAGVLPWERAADVFDIETRILETEQGRVDFDALKDAVADAREPRRTSYRGVMDASDPDYELRPGARQLEIGTTSPAPHAAATTAMDTIEDIGLDTVQSRIERLTDRLKDGLGDRLLSPREYESGLVTFAADDPEALVTRLDEAGVVIRSLPSPDAVRASVHVFNTADDIDRLLDAL